MKNITISAGKQRPTHKPLFNNSKSNGPRKPVRKPKSGNTRSGGLDAHAAAYARLLADPENAPLVHPTYSGAEGGYLTRAVSTFSVGTGTGQTAGFVHFTPGMIGPNGYELMTGVGTEDTTPIPPIINFGLSPGRTFITATASGVRCVAACMQVCYNGAELNRSGRVFFGATSGGLIDFGQSQSIYALAQTLPNSMRTPSSEFKVMWKPNNADEIMIDPGNTVGAKAGDCAAITLAFSGLAAATGLSVRLTCVYEWQPNVGFGMAIPTTSRIPSRNTLEDVIGFLMRNGEQFIRVAGAAYGGYLTDRVTRRAIAF